MSLINIRSAPFSWMPAVLEGDPEILGIQGTISDSKVVVIWGSQFQKQRNSEPSTSPRIAGWLAKICFPVAKVLLITGPQGGPSLEITIATVAFHFKGLNKHPAFPLPPELELSCTLLKPQILVSSFPLVLSIWAGIESNLLTYLEASEGREYLSPWGTNWLKQFADRTLEESQLLHEMPSLVSVPCLTP